MKFASQNERKVRRFTAEQWPCGCQVTAGGPRVGRGSRRFPAAAGSADRPRRRRSPSAAERSGRAPIDPSAGDSRSADVRDFPGRSGGRRRASSNRWTLPSADGAVGVARPLNRPKMAPADGSDRRTSPTLTPLVDRPADAFVLVGGHHVTPSTT